MEETRVTHQTINGKYRIQFEQVGSAKGIVGFKVEANSDDIGEAQRDALELLNWAKLHAPNESKALTN
jgi:hypothetical protein